MRCARVKAAQIYGLAKIFERNRGNCASRLRRRRVNSVINGLAGCLTSYGRHRPSPENPLQATANVW